MLYGYRRFEDIRESKLMWSLNLDFNNYDRVKIPACVLT